MKIEDLTDERGVLVIDPGGTTGWSEWGREGDGLVPWSGGQIPGGSDGFNEWIEGRYAFGARTEGIAHVIIEGMEQDATTGFADIHDAFYIIGAVKLWAHQERVSVEIQRRGQKALVSDDVLRRAGLWKQGHRHEMDTFRHALAWAFAQDHQPTIAAFWPPEHWESSAESSSSDFDCTSCGATVDGLTRSGDEGWCADCLGSAEPSSYEGSER